MSAEIPIDTSEVVTSVDETISSLLQRKWQDYFPEQDSQLPSMQKQERVIHALQGTDVLTEGGRPPLSDRIRWQEGVDGNVVDKKIPAFDKDIRSSELIGRLTKEVFTPFNPKIGEAIGASMYAALDILAPLGKEYAGKPESKEFQAFANYYILLVALSSEFGLDTPVEGKAKYAVTPFPVDIEYGRSHAFSDGSQLNTYRVDMHDYLGAREAWDVDDDGRKFVYDFRRHPVGLTMHTQPGVRANFSLDQYGSTQEHLRQSVQMHQRGTEREYTDFSIRLDKDNSMPNGFSLDIGRDARGDGGMHRPGDVVGRALQASRQEYGSHFSEYFEGVTEADFNDFIDNLGTFLRADAEIARLDQSLREHDRLNYDARWFGDPFWKHQLRYVPHTSGALGKPPYGPADKPIWTSPRSAQK
jgi:hypothetical protein